MRSAILACVLAAAALPALGEVTLYGRPDFQGRTFTTHEQVRNLEREGFANRASSAVVRGEPYEFCDDRAFSGQCVTLPPGRYPSLAAMGMNDAIVSVRPAVAGPAEITLYGREDFEGRSLSTADAIRNLERHDFNDRASSAVVRGGRFEICEGRAFEGRCTVLRPGQYPSLAAMGMNDGITSVRPLSRQAQFEERRHAPPPAQERRYAPPPPPVAHDYRPRRDERLFEADVVAVRAVYGRAEQRCWVEREAVAAPGDANVGGAIVGGIIGGIIGHQIGSGRGNDAATAAGAIAGAAIGANQGVSTTYTRDVERCAPSQASGRPEFFDVRYRFRGVERTVQMTQPPGPTILVNRDGEPRAAS